MIVEFLLVFFLPRIKIGIVLLVFVYGCTYQQQNTTRQKRKRQRTGHYQAKRHLEHIPISLSLESIIIILSFSFFSLFNCQSGRITGLPLSVWPDLAKFRHFGKSFLVFDKFLTVYFLFGKMLSLLWQIWAIFIVANGQILKNNLTIWSHWPLFDKAPLPFQKFDANSLGLEWENISETIDLQFYLSIFNCFAYFKLTTDLLVWSYCSLQTK